MFERKTKGAVRYQEVNDKGEPETVSHVIDRATAKASARTCGSAGSTASCRPGIPAGRSTSMRRTGTHESKLESKCADSAAIIKQRASAAC